VTSARGKTRALWLGGGALALGTGIWCMHYIGMLAFHLPMPVLYDWPKVLLSLFAAILASAVALFVVSRETMGLVRASLGALVMGAAIPVMHYTGMAAASFAPSLATHESLSHALSISALGIAGIIPITFMILGLALLTSLADRYFSAQALELRSSDQSISTHNA
jgi:two-component system sensor histidine kinase/response regulator